MVFSATISSCAETALRRSSTTSMKDIRCGQRDLAELVREAEISEPLRATWGKRYEASGVHFENGDMYSRSMKSLTSAIGPIGAQAGGADPDRHACRGHWV